MLSLMMTSFNSVSPAVLPRHCRSSSPCSSNNNTNIHTFDLHQQQQQQRLPPSWYCVAKESQSSLCSKPIYSRNSYSYITFSSSSSLKRKSKATQVQVSDLHQENNNSEEEFQVLTAIRSSYNDILILDTPTSRLLLLDPTHNVHSIFNKGEKWTGSYWDEFASLPPIIPHGHIAILGLGGGTAAHLMLELWPSLQLQGWEIDEILIDKAREYLHLSDLEKHTQAGGILHVHVGDALSSSVNVLGGYAGIVIDLFSDGKVLPQLQEVETWLELKNKLMPYGRLMVNCGAANLGASDSSNTSHDTWIENSTIKALSKAFPGQLSWKKMPKTEGENYLALTGPLPDLTTWSAVLPNRLSSSIKQWQACCST